MLSKFYRLKENEVKKVLKLGKPFFSCSIVLNYHKNNLNFDRFAVIIAGKSVKGSVERNFFRRRFYKIIDFFFLNKEKNQNESNIKTGVLPNHYDMVFLVKKQTKLEKNNFESIKSFETDLNFLIKKIKYLNKNNTTS